MGQPEKSQNRQPVIRTLKQLHENTSSIIEMVNVENQIVLITHHGRFVGVIEPLSDTEILGAGLSKAVDELDDGIKARVLGTKPVDKSYRTYEAFLDDEGLDNVGTFFD